jgi:hypothetical protein
MLGLPCAIDGQNYQMLRAGIDLHHPRSSRAEVCAEGQVSFRRRRARTEQEIEDVAKAIYLLRVAPRRLPRKWDELTIEAHRSFEKDAIAAIMAPDALRLGRTADQCVEVKIPVLFLRISKTKQCERNLCRLCSSPSSSDRRFQLNDITGLERLCDSLIRANLTPCPSVRGCRDRRQEAL